MAVRLKHAALAMVLAAATQVARDSRAGSGDPLPPSPGGDVTGNPAAVPAPTRVAAAPTTNASPDELRVPAVRDPAPIAVPSPVAALPEAAVAADPAGSSDSADGVFPAGSAIGFPAPLTLSDAPATSAGPGVPRLSVNDVLGSPGQPRLLMSLLRDAGWAKFLDDAGTAVYGHAQAGYTLNLAQPGFHLNVDHLFDSRDQDLMLNQFSLNVERGVFRGDHVDLGYRLELMYGTDAQIIHANGMSFHTNPRGFFGAPEEQFDIPQAYLDLYLPVGQGLRLRAGKFRAFFGGPIDPEETILYSRSFLFSGSGAGVGFTDAGPGGFSTDPLSARPFTFTGLMATYPVRSRGPVDPRDEPWTIDLGINRGWDQSLEDNNDALSFVARYSYQFDPKTRAALAVVTGPELRDDNSHYRTLVDLVVTHRATDDLLLMFNATYGHEGGTRFIPFSGERVGPRETDWYGTSGYFRYTLSPQVKLNGRVEWFRDEEGSRMFFPGSRYEATLGLSVTPFTSDRVLSNLEIRPEIRYDYAEKPIYDLNEFGGSRHGQFLFSVDMVFKF